MNELKMCLNIDEEYMFTKEWWKEEKESRDIDEIKERMRKIENIFKIIKEQIELLEYILKD